MCKEAELYWLVDNSIHPNDTDNWRIIDFFFFF